jgi:hypothetical protein
MLLIALHSWTMLVIGFDDLHDSRHGWQEDGGMTRGQVLATYPFRPPCRLGSPPVSALITHRLAREDGLVTFRTLVVACAMTAFLTAVGATALSSALAPTPKPVTRVVAVRIADTVPAAVAPSTPAVPAPAAPAANAWVVAGAAAAAAASGAGGQLDPSPPGVLAGGSLVADDLVAPCATLSLAGAVSRGLAGCP